MCGPSSRRLSVMIVEAKAASVDHLPRLQTEEMEVLDLRETDVLLGRGNGVGVHPGNIKFRRLIKDYRSAYREAPRYFKIRVAKNVIYEIENQSPPGRFLRFVEEGRYLIVSPSKALEKTSQALRERIYRRKSRVTLNSSTGNEGSKDSQTTVHDVNPLLLIQHQSNINRDISMNQLMAFFPQRILPLQHATGLSWADMGLAARTQWSADVFLSLCACSLRRQADGQFDDAPEPTGYSESLFLWQVYARAGYFGRRV